MANTITCDLSRDRAVCHFDGRLLDDILLEWWGLLVAGVLFCLLALPEIVVLFRNRFELSFGFLTSVGLRVLALVMEAWAMASLVTYQYHFPHSCDARRPSAYSQSVSINCLLEPECTEENCDSFEQAGALVEIILVSAFAILNYIPKLMAACAKGRVFAGADFEKAFWHIVSDRTLCCSGWLLIILPYIQAFVLVFTLSDLDNVLIGNGWQSFLDTLVRIGVSLVIGALGIWTFIGIGRSFLSALCCRQQMEIPKLLSQTVKVMQTSFFIVDIFAALLFAGSYALGSLYMTADAVVLGWGLFSSCCCGVDDDLSVNDYLTHNEEYDGDDDVDGNVELTQAVNAT